jgi:hypothetical protein
VNSDARLVFLKSGPLANPNRNQRKVLGLPKSLHMDNAREFKSEAIRRGCDEYGIEKLFRPIAQPHFGGDIERLIGTLMGSVHLLPGTTSSNVAERGDYDSAKSATMTLAESRPGWRSKSPVFAGCSPVALEKYGLPLPYVIARKCADLYGQGVRRPSGVRPEIQPIESHAGVKAAAQRSIFCLAQRFRRRGPKGPRKFVPRRHGEVLQ